MGPFFIAAVSDGWRRDDRRSSRAKDRMSLGRVSIAVWGDGSMTPESLGALVRSVAADPDVWQPKLRLPRPDGQRWWTCLSADALVDVWLLSWLPGQATDLHDHGPSAAAFTVVRGELAEVRVDAEGRWSRYRRAIGAITSLPIGLVHDVHGAGNGPAVSIHAYSPPLRRMTFYSRNKQGRLYAVRSVATEQPELARLG